MQRVSYIVGNGVLVPKGLEACEQLAALAIGEQVAVEITRPRSPKFNAMVHLTLERVAAAMGVTVRACRAWLLVNTGRDSIVQWWSGETVIVPHSIGDMNAIEFEAFWADASAVIRADVLPYLDAGDADDIARRLAVAPRSVEEQQTAAPASRHP